MPFDPTQSYATTRNDVGNTYYLQGGVYYDQKGNVVTPPFPANYSGTLIVNTPALGLDRSLTVTTTAQQLMAANPDRQGFYVVNDSAVDVYVNIGATAVAAAGSGNIKLTASGGKLFSWDLGVTPSSAISIVCASSTAAVTAREF